MKSILNGFAKALTLIQDSGAMYAAMTWPKFSLASYTIVSRLARNGIAPGTVIDVGANVGQFAIAAAKHFTKAQVISFEPDPRVADLLRRNVSGLPRISVHELALSEQRGTAQFFVNEDSQVSSLLRLGHERLRAFPRSTVRESIEVRVETLDSMFLELELQPSILLKLDVQGAEERVLRGGATVLKRIDWIVAEVAFADLYEGEADFQAIADNLREHGFRFVRPLNYHVSPESGDIIEMDALFSR